MSGIKLQEVRSIKQRQKKIGKQLIIFLAASICILRNCFLSPCRNIIRSKSSFIFRLGKDVFTVIPTTFLVTQGTTDPEWTHFMTYYEEVNQQNKKDKKGSNIWICKPGQNSNRGHGIHVVSSLQEIRSMVSQKCGSSHTLIIQKYMENPFLYNKRKFDLRMFILITCVNGCIKGYWYEDGYARTTSK